MTAHEGSTLIGIGECSTIPGLSIDDPSKISEKIEASFRQESFDHMMFPAVTFGREMLRRSLNSSHPFVLYNNAFSRGEVGIPINGLIWMGSKTQMNNQILEKLNQGFTCLKLKIGAIDFEEEMSILKSIRAEYSADDIELRVDANGAFTIGSALDKLKRLAALDLHSIEQPIKQGQWQEMAHLCQETPLDIALDEELIGVYTQEERMDLLTTIRPQYIILKPSLVGGFKHSEQWIEIAKENEIGWWVTSALESNVGLNAIAQWTSSLSTELHQGLGTGGLFTNNIGSPLSIRDAMLWYDPEVTWATSFRAFRYPKET